MLVNPQTVARSGDAAGMGEGAGAPFPAHQCEAAAPRDWEFLAAPPKRKTAVRRAPTPIPAASPGRRPR
jgi:hypothetical protein